MSKDKISGRSGPENTAGDKSAQDTHYATLRRAHRDAKRERGEIPTRKFARMSDEEIIESLTRVNGIGRWTAEMFLIFRLQRPDVLPVGDLGIVRAVQRAYKLRKAPSPDRLTRIGEAWRPYRSVACWYLWASLNNEPTKD